MTSNVTLAEIKTRLPERIESTKTSLSKLGAGYQLAIVPYQTRIDELTSGLRQKISDSKSEYDGVSKAFSSQLRNDSAVKSAELAISMYKDYSRKRTMAKALAALYTPVGIVFVGVPYIGNLSNPDSVDWFMLGTGIVMLSVSPLYFYIKSWLSKRRFEKTFGQGSLTKANIEWLNERLGEVETIG